MTASGRVPPAATAAPLALIADDDRGVGALLREVLTRVGLRTIGVTDGAAALAVLDREDVAVLVCDLDMPELRGQEVLARLEARSGSPPALVISGYVDAAMEGELAARRIVRRVFRKPFDVIAFAEQARRLAAEWSAARAAPP